MTSDRRKTFYISKYNASLHKVSGGALQTNDCNTDTIVKQGGLTSVVQPLYVCLNKPFTDKQMEELFGAENSAEMKMSLKVKNNMGKKFLTSSLLLNSRSLLVLFFKCF